MPTIIGNCLDVLPTLESGSVNCCVTSPPYWGLRDYGNAAQLGLEKTPEEYVAKMVAVFREVKRVLRDDGTLWLNLGDSYFSDTKGSGGPSEKQDSNAGSRYEPKRFEHSVLKSKDLCGIPWRVAFALQADGWYLRQDIIWHKPNPMPESVTDRCTKSHEYIFLLSKSERYYFDAAAIAEPLAEGSIDRLSQPGLDEQAGSDRVPGKTNGNMKAVGKRPHGIVRNRELGYDSKENALRGKTGLNPDGISEGMLELPPATRNKRSVWTVTTKPFSGAHFATFPPDLIQPCILAGCPVGGMVLDPFGGSGTTGQVAESLGRQWTLIELNPEYGKLIVQRTSQIGLELV